MKVSSLSSSMADWITWKSSHYKSSINTGQNAVNTHRNAPEAKERWQHGEQVGGGGAGFRQVYWPWKPQVWASRWKRDCVLGPLKVGRWNWDSPHKAGILKRMNHYRNNSLEKNLPNGTGRQENLSWHEQKVERKVFAENMGLRLKFHVNLGVEFTLSVGSRIPEPEK